MRRTAALVSAITLLTACSSGDIVVKTDLDESYVVKDSAVSEIKSPYESKIQDLEKDIKSNRDDINTLIEGAKDCSIKHRILGQARCNSIWLEGKSKHEAAIKIYEGEIQVLKDAMKAEEPLIKQVKYRPIFIDLNDDKKAMGYVTLTCLNPNVEAKDAAELFSALGETIAEVDLSKAYYTAGSKVCQKYAYKDGGVFAYREAKKSDESKESD